MAGNENVTLTKEAPPNYTKDKHEQSTAPSIGAPPLRPPQSLSLPHAGVPPPCPSGPSQPPHSSYTITTNASNPMRTAGIGEKSVVEAYLLAVSPLGVLGAHHFYLQRYYWGILYFFTIGLMGCGYIIDWFRVPCLVRQANSRRSRSSDNSEEPKTVSDAYTLWFPFGLLGFHQYYLGNYAWGVVYTCTLGLFGIGWLVDAFRIPYLVKSANEEMLLSPSGREKQLCAAYAIGLTPLGILGAHHYYLNRPIWGIVYTFTLGLMGLGWIFDWIRMTWLVSRANQVIKGRRADDTRTVDDAYILWLTFGLIGFHHFYLGRPLWGLLYFFTLGLLGMGSLIDMCRIPFLVKQVNKENEEKRRILTSQLEELKRQSLGQGTSFPVTAYMQGTISYQNYGVANPGAYTPTNPPFPGPEPLHHYQGAYNPSPQAQFPPHGPFMTYQQSGHGPSGPVPGYSGDGFYPPAYNYYNPGSVPQTSTAGDVNPPPYMPREQEATQDPGALPEKHQIK
ncbi:unnamed protein product [Lymnaea stagnalis]|uniref:TM2 domain-containing protein n=1 Tax=Lymnaea stagnalis TaxID=6523 RepID=A0AAV2IKN3_LYMST